MVFRNYKNKIKYRLGTFKTELEAARAYNTKAIELYGEYANLNTVSDQIEEKASIIIN